VPEAPNAYFYSGEVVRIWAHVPTTWHAVIDPNECCDIAELLKETGDKERALLASSTQKISRLIAAEVARQTRYTNAPGARRNYHSTHMADESTEGDEAAPDLPALAATNEPI
jgi:hypothetical protein